VNEKEREFHAILGEHFFGTKEKLRAALAAFDVFICPK
jgi:hypothetical protein